MQQSILPFVNQIAHDIEGHTILRCHKTAALLVTLFNTGPYLNGAQAYGPEDTFLDDFRNNAGRPMVYLCCCPLSFIGASHSWIVITLNAFALHLESNSPNWSLKQWLTGAPVDSVQKKTLTPARWLPVESYAHLAEHFMDELTDCVIDWEERSRIRWARYPLNRNISLLNTEEARRQAITEAKPFQDYINQAIGT